MSIHLQHTHTHTPLLIPDMHHEIDCKGVCACVVCACVVIECVSRGWLLSPPTCLKSSKGMNVTLGQLTGALSTHTHIHTHTHKHTHLHSYADTQMCKHAFKEIHRDWCLHVFTGIDYNTHTHIHTSSTICKCLVLLVTVSRRAAECQWGETGGVNLCGDSETLLRYSSTACNLNSSQSGQIICVTKNIVFFLTFGSLLCTFFSGAIEFLHLS